MRIRQASADIVTFLCIFNGGNLGEPELGHPAEGVGPKRAAQAQAAVPRLAPGGNVLFVPSSRHVAGRHALRYANLMAYAYIREPSIQTD
jgi:hypothetical protein